jgi:hypothetical protein
VTKVKGFLHLLLAAILPPMINGKVHHVVHN